MSNITIKQSYKYCPLHYIEGLNHKTVDLMNDFYSYSTYMMTEYSDKMFNAFWLENIDSIIEVYEDDEEINSLIEDGKHSKNFKKLLPEILKYFKDLRKAMIDNNIEFITI